MSLRMLLVFFLIERGESRRVFTWILSVTFFGGRSKLGVKVFLLFAFPAFSFIIIIDKK